MINNLSLVSVKRSTSGPLVSILSSRFYCQDFRTIPEPNISSLKRGTGGRSSFNGDVVTVFGATGFLGRYICNQLGKRGSQMIIPHRCEPDSEELKNLKLAGDLGQVLFQPFYLRDITSIHKAVKYSNVVINLINNFSETSNFDHYALHVKGAMEIAKACREQNVERLIHFSALNVNQNPQKYYLKNNKFFEMKLKGEEAVLNEFPDATIFRPSNIYGERDSFLWPLVSPNRRSFDFVPLYAKGLKTIKQPVYATDVAHAVINAINNYHTRGKIYQIVGPERYYLHDITLYCLQVVQAATNLRPQISDIKYDIWFLLRYIFNEKFIRYFQATRTDRISPEYIEIESTSDYVDHKLPTTKDLGVSLSKFQDVVPAIILPYFLKKGYLIRDPEDYAAAFNLSNKVVKPYSF